MRVEKLTPMQLEVARSLEEQCRATAAQAEGLATLAKQQRELFLRFLEDCKAQLGAKDDEEWDLQWPSGVFLITQQKEETSGTTED